MAISTISTNRTLLWTNSSPSNAFNPQTVPLDLSNYSEVEIQFLGSTNSSDSATVLCPVGKNAMARFIGGGNGYGSGTPFLAERGFNTTTSGVEFLKGLGTFITDNTWAYNNNTRVIPWRIYGIK